MHLLVATFSLAGVSDADYRLSCEEEAAAFASVPGLISKVWLADERANTYGGVYMIADREALDAYTQSDLFKSIAADPTVTNFNARSFEVLEGPTRVTRGLMAVAG